MATMTTEALRLPGGARGLSLPATLDGGQAFRWRPLEDGRPVPPAGGPGGGPVPLRPRRGGCRILAELS